MNTNTNVNGNGRSKTIKSKQLELELPEQMPAELAPQIANPELGRKTLTIPKLETREIILMVRGTTPLVVHNFSTKNDLAVSGGGGKARDPKLEYNRARYVIEGKDAFKAVSFKHALVSACGFLRGGALKWKGPVMKTVHVFGNLDAGMFCELTGAGPQIFEEAVRKADGGSTLCYRPIYKIWGCQLRIEFNPRQLTDEDVLTLVQNAGDYCGVGEMRPSKKGLGYGRFAIDQKFPIEAKGVER